MSKHDLTIFRYSTMLTLTRNGISTIAELEAMSNAEIANIRGLDKRGYDEILAVLGRQEPDRPGSNVPKQPTVPPMQKATRRIETDHDQESH